MLHIHTHTHTPAHTHSHVASMCHLVSVRVVQTGQKCYSAPSRMCVCVCMCVYTHTYVCLFLIDTRVWCKQVKSAIPHPLIMGVIHECGGKMHMQERDWESGAPIESMRILLLLYMCSSYTHIWYMYICIYVCIYIYI